MINLRHRALRAGHILVLATVLAAGGCAGERSSPLDTAVTRASPPSDFWLAVTVYAPEARPGDEPVARSERAARYVIEADQVLRVSIGSGVSEETFPPQTRQLDAGDVDALWESLRTGSLVDAASPHRVTGPVGGVEASGGPVYVVSFRAAGELRRLRVEGGAEGAGAEAKGLADRLGALAWMPE
jgi:hypothetical protein